MSRPCARRQDHETAIAATGSRLVLNRREGTAGASHSAADRCAAASQAASPAIPGNRRSPRVTASSTADRKSTRLNSSHLVISYAVFCLKKKNNYMHACSLTLSPSVRHHPALAVVACPPWTAVTV